jgi:glycosyltransferase involved in cell wall biosynthesis
MENAKESTTKYPDFSVLMSVYSKEEASNLKIALKSIVEQTLPPKEIVIVHDGPISYQLQLVIDGIKQSISKQVMLKEVKLKENVGLGLALQAGTQAVETEWIARMDSDDVATPDRFKLQFNEILRNPNLAVIGGQIDEFDEKITNVIGRRMVPCSKSKIIKFAKYRSPFNHPTVIINKAKLNEVGGYVDFRNLEDYYLWVRFLFSDFEVFNVDRVVLHMRSGKDLYKRRTGLGYLKRYIKLRSIMRKKQFLNFFEEVTGDAFMTINVMVPNIIRELVYKKILHKE